MNKLSQFVATIGQSIQFCAGCAHFFCAAYVVSHSGHYRWWVAGVFVVGGAIKETWDNFNESDPPQTIMDGIEDWAGWVLGAAVGLIH